MNSRFQLELAAKELAPLRQGDLDGLCGLYAVINAVRLVVHPHRALRRPELRQLFDCGLASLSRLRTLRWSVANGMVDRVWIKVCEDVVAEAASIANLELFTLNVFDGELPTDTPSAARLIKSKVRDGWPVLVALMDSLDHTTVIAGFNRTRLDLFDSSGHRGVRIRSLSFDPANPGTPHFVPATSVMAVLAL